MNYTQEQIADSITRFLIGDSTNALKELEMLKAVVTNISHNAVNADTGEGYNKFFKKTYEQILKIVRQ